MNLNLIPRSSKRSFRRWPLKSRVWRNSLFHVFHEEASFSLAVPGPLGGGRGFFISCSGTNGDFRAPKRGPGISSLPGRASELPGEFSRSARADNKPRYQYAKSPVVLRSLGSDEVCPAGRSSPKTYQTRQDMRSSSGQLMSSADGRRSGLGCTFLESSALSEIRRNRMYILLPSTGGRAETVVRVTVRRGVPVTVRRADVRLLERSNARPGA